MADRFRLDGKFLDSYKNRKPPFGFNGLGELTYYRTYSRLKDDGTNEVWWETVQRVVEGTYNMQKTWIEQNSLGWKDKKAQKSAQEMYDIIWNMKFLPPGRGLWAMGSALTEERGLFACLNNCAFISTEYIADDPSQPFCFLMDASMLGVGVGFDTLGAEKIKIRQPGKMGAWEFKIPDSREGWVHSVAMLLNSYFSAASEVTFDYSEVRPAGLPIKGFGGLSSGPEPLQELHESIRSILDGQVGEKITRTTIVDLMNMIGKCVVAGNVRRTAEMALCEDPYSNEYLQLKNYEINPHRASFGWTSNNSISAPLGADYIIPAIGTQLNGEPGYQWLENSRAFSRMNGLPDNKDRRAAGVNPCQPGFATVLTPSGIRTFDEVKEGDRVWTAEGFSTVVNKLETGVKPVYLYRTTSGIFIGTDKHRVMCEGEKVEVGEAHGIDPLVGPTNIHPASIQSIMDGLVIGDGQLNSSTRGKRVLLNIGQNDLDYFESEVASLIETDSYDEEARRYAVTSTIEPHELGPTYTRTIPDRFFTNPTQAASFLRGLYSANGSIVSNRITLKTSSPGLRDQVQVLLSSLGISSYYTTNKPHEVEFENGTYECRESYDINISISRVQFAALIGFIQKYKQEKLKDLVKRLGITKPIKTTYDIIGRRYLGDHPVYSITVGNITHTYWTGGVNVANCGEQTLESHELCNLVETFPNRCATLDEYKRTLKFAYLYAKTVTLGKTHWPETNRKMLRNRRIGCSMSGIAQFITARGIHELQRWCNEGYRTLEYYDEVYSDWMAIPRSIKMTSIKPSGTVSLLAGATPGIHYPESRCYIRRVRLDNKSSLVQPLIDAGYTVEPCIGAEGTTLVVEVPVRIEEDIRTLEEVSMWEQLSLAAFMQKYWADNQVSCTITFTQDEARHIPFALNYMQYQLKGVSFLPRLEKGAYAQMPYEAISEERYAELAAGLKPLEFGVTNELVEVERFCTNDSCTIGGNN